MDYVLQLLYSRKRIVKIKTFRHCLCPEGVYYINSWIDENLTTCYQVMESESDEKMHKWVNMNKGPVDYEVIKVITSIQAKEKKLRS